MPVRHAFQADLECPLLLATFYGDETSNLMVLRYETLVSEPVCAIAAAYAFIDEPAYAHDFDNIHFQADAFDQRLGTPGLHTVHHQVATKKRTSVLPPDVFRRFANDAFWLGPAQNPRQVKVVQTGVGQNGTAGCRFYRQLKLAGSLCGPGSCRHWRVRCHPDPLGVGMAKSQQRHGIPMELNEALFDELVMPPLTRGRSAPPPAAGWRHNQKQAPK